MYHETSACHHRPIDFCGMQCRIRMPALVVGPCTPLSCAIANGHGFRAPYCLRACLVCMCSDSMSCQPTCPVVAMQGRRPAPGPPVIPATTGSSLCPVCKTGLSTSPTSAGSAIYGAKPCNSVLLDLHCSTINMLACYWTLFIPAHTPARTCTQQLHT